MYKKLYIHARFFMDISRKERLEVRKVYFVTGPLSADGTILQYGLAERRQENRTTILGTIDKIVSFATSGCICPFLASAVLSIFYLGIGVSIFGTFFICHSSIFCS